VVVRAGGINCSACAQARRTVESFDIAVNEESSALSAVVLALFAALLVCGTVAARIIAQR